MWHTKLMGACKNICYKLFRLQSCVFEKFSIFPCHSEMIGIHMHSSKFCILTIEDCGRVRRPGGGEARHTGRHHGRANGGPEERVWAGRGGGGRGGHRWAMTMQEREDCFMARSSASCTSASLCASSALVACGSPAKRAVQGTVPVDEKAPRAMRRKVEQSTVHRQSCYNG